MARDIPDSLRNHPVHIIEGSFEFFSTLKVAFDWLAANRPNRAEEYPDFAPLLAMLEKIEDASFGQSVDKVTLTLSAAEAIAFYNIIEDFNDAVEAGLVLVEPNEIPNPRASASDTLNGAAD